MPTISRFRGITIWMYFSEAIHAGRPHFHAEYAGASASFEIVTQARLAGALPARIERLVRQWGRAHAEELMANWERARDGRQLEPIDPLK